MITLKSAVTMSLRLLDPSSLKKQYLRLKKYRREPKVLRAFKALLGQVQLLETE